MAVTRAFLTLVEKVKEDPSAIKGMKTVYQFDLKEGETYQIKIADDTVEFNEGSPEEAICTLAMSEKNLLKLFQGELNPTNAFMTGRLKIKGDLSLAMKLQSILDKYK